MVSQACIKKSTTFTEWVYSNPAYIKDSLPEPEIYATPQAYSLTRLISQESLGRDGRPISMPPLPRAEYQLPRAQISTSTSHLDRGQDRRHQSRKVIRTPSGKRYSASDYLRGGYLPSQPSLEEEESRG